VAKKWSKEEELQVCQMLDNGYTPKQVGERLGRTTRAVEKRYVQVLRGSLKDLSMIRAGRRIDKALERLKRAREK
jgi:predicted transcriptional regulator